MLASTLASSSAPTWPFASAAASARRERSATSALSSAERRRKAAAAARPPRACARAAERSSSRATSSEHDARAQLEHPFTFQRDRRRLVDTEAVGRAPHERRVARRLGGGDKQQATRRRGELPEPSPEARFYATRDGHRDR
jgi:hypothetical protein